MGAITSHYNLAIIIQEQRRGNAVRKLKQDIELVNQRLDKNGIATAQASTKTEEFVTKTKRLGQAIRKVLVPALLLAASAAAKFGVDAVKAFGQFDKGMQEVFTLLPNRSKELENELTKGIRNISAELGYLTEETIPALYQALSAGVPEENAIAAVELAAKAAKAGAADLESTMRIGMAVVNAYGGEIYSLENAYDLIFQLVDKGVPRLQDWGNSLQDVISIASEARTPFEDIVAALAVMTRQGDSAAESAELLGFILMQMQIEGTSAAKAFMEATGTSYREWIATGHGLVEGLEVLNQHAIDTGQHLDSMIGGGSNFYRDQQAARGVMELTGLHMKELRDISEEVGDEMEGSMMKAYGTAADNAQQTMDEMSSKWENLKLKIGEAIWNAEIFFGLTGEGMVDAAGLVVDYASGKLGDDLIDELEDSIDAATKVSELIDISKQWVDEDRELKIPFLIDGIPLFAQTAEEGNKLLATELAKYIQTWDEWDRVTREIGLREDYELPNVGFVYNAQGEDPFGMQEELEASQRLAKNNEIERQSQLEYDRIRRENLREVRSLRQENLETSREGVLVSRERWVAEHRAETAYNAQWDLQVALLQNNLDIYDSQGQISTQLEDQTEFYKDLFENSEGVAQMVHWQAVETQKLNQEQLTFMGIVTQQGKNLTTAFADLQAAGGEWTTIIRDNSAEIESIMGDLSADLSDEERSVMQGILRDSEEGGSDWLSSWRRLQSDLTETQRNELVARLADLQASQGNYEGVWTGDREKAEAAAERIIAAFEAIDEAYYTMGENMVTNKILTDIRLTDTVAGQQAALEWQVALGNIDEEIAEPMRKELEAAAKLEPILDEMYTAYMGDGALAREEAGNMATAIEVVHTQSKNLTEKGLKAYLDKALSDTGGYPYVAGVIRDDVNAELKKSQKQMDEMTKKPVVPEVKLDKSSFDTLYEEMMRQIEDAKGPHNVVFNATYNEGQPNEEQATGTGGSYRTVPGGYPNDSYLVGLTSGERFAVLTPGQAARGMGSGDNRLYIDQSQTIVNNHTAAAAAVSRAYLDTLYDQRLRRFAGE